MQTYLRDVKALLVLCDWMPAGYAMRVEQFTLCARDAGGYALFTALYAGGRGGGALFGRDSVDAGGDALCAALYSGGCGGLALFVSGV